MSIFGNQPALGAGGSFAPAASGGGLFGSTGKGNQPAQCQPTLFGNKSPARANVPKINVSLGAPGMAGGAAGGGAGGLFGAQGAGQAQPAGGQGLFGQQSAQPGLFQNAGGQPQPTGGLQSALSFGPQQPQQAHGGGFGQLKAPGAAPSGGGFSGFQQPQPQHQMQMQPAYSSYFPPPEELRNKKQVNDLINYYYQILEPTSDSNRFRAVLYNRINPGMPDEQRKYLTENVPRTINGKPIDLHKWLNAVESNPIKKELHPDQVSSVAELKERTLKTLANVKKTRVKLTQVTEGMHSVQRACEDDIRINLQRAKDGNQQITDRLMSIFGKLEHFLLEQGRAKINRDAQEELVNAQKADLEKISDPTTGLIRKLDMIKRQNHQIHVQEENYRLPGQGAGESDFDCEHQQVSDADLRDMLRVLQKQKEGIQILQSSVNDSARQLMVMDKELDLL